MKLKYGPQNIKTVVPAHQPKNQPFWNKCSVWVCFKYARNTSLSLSCEWGKISSDSNRDCWCESLYTASETPWFPMSHYDRIKSDWQYKHMEMARSHGVEFGLHSLASLSHHIEMPRKTPKFKKEALFYLRKHDTVRERKWVWKTGHERDEGSGIWGGKWAIFDRVSDQAVVMFIKDWFDVNVKDMKAEKKDSWIYAILNLRGEENPLLARGRISCSRFLKKVRVKEQPSQRSANEDDTHQNFFSNIAQKLQFFSHVFIPYKNFSAIVFIIIYRKQQNKTWNKAQTTKEQK